MELQEEIENCRQRWLKAKEEKNEKLMNLWEKVGKTLKEIANQEGEETFDLAKKIFNEKDPS